MSEKFQTNCEQQGISLSISGVETHNSIGAGESFHRHLRRVYNCIRRAHPSVYKEHVLRLSVKAVNDTVGPNGLVPSELVFGVRPTFPIAPKTNPTQSERFQALQTARNEIAQITAERRVNDSLRRKIPPASSYLIRPGDSVRVYREPSRAYDGPFTVTRVDRKLITVTDGKKAKTFNVSQVMPNSAPARDPVTQRQLDRIFDHSINSVEVLKSTDPRYSSKASRDAIRD